MKCPRAQQETPVDADLCSECRNKATAAWVQNMLGTGTVSQPRPHAL
jgi:hypothetical protein